jgi:hypothetical protein
MRSGWTDLSPRRAHVTLRQSIDGNRELPVEHKRPAACIVFCGPLCGDVAFGCGQRPIQIDGRDVAAPPQVLGHRLEDRRGIGWQPTRCLGRQRSRKISARTRGWVAVRFLPKIFGRTKAGDRSGPRAHRGAAIRPNETHRTEELLARIIHERARGDRAGAAAGAGGLGPVEPFRPRATTTQRSRVGTAPQVIGTESAVVRATVRAEGWHGHARPASIHG